MSGIGASLAAVLGPMMGETCVGSPNSPTVSCHSNSAGAPEAVELSQILHVPILFRTVLLVLIILIPVCFMIRQEISWAPEYHDVRVKQITLHVIF